jgi:hypothetical protein
MRALRLLARLFGISLLAILVAVGLLALRPASTAPLDGPNAIAALEKISLGGVEQTILSSRAGPRRSTPRAARSSGSKIPAI